MVRTEAVVGGHGVAVVLVAVGSVLTLPNFWSGRLSAGRWQHVDTCRRVSCALSPACADIAP